MTEFEELPVTDEPDYVPPTEAIEQTLIAGFRHIAGLLGADPEEATDAEILADFHRWLEHQKSAAQAVSSDAGQWIDHVGKLWDAVESTDDYDDFADEVGGLVESWRNRSAE